MRHEKMTNKSINPKAFYGVASGKRVGVFDNWMECEEQVKGYSGAAFKKFKSEKEAIGYVKTKNPEFALAPKIIEEDQSEIVVEDPEIAKKQLLCTRASLYATISAIQNNQDKGVPLHVKISKDVIEGISSLGIEDEDRVIPEEISNYDMWLTLSEEIKSFSKKLVFSSSDNHGPV